MGCCPCSLRGRGPLASPLLLTRRVGSWLCELCWLISGGANTEVTWQTGTTGVTANPAALG